MNIITVYEKNENNDSYCYIIFNRNYENILYRILVKWLINVMIY